LSLEGRSTFVYTDGACAGNPGPGGWGVVIIQDGVRRELSGGFRKTTNNRMEILSVISSLEALSSCDSLMTIYSDSQYVVDMMNNGHVLKWQRNGWMRDRKQAAMNPDLWERLLKLCEGREVEFTWVRGHNGTVENERADELAVEARQGEGLPVDEGYEAPPLFVGDSLFS